MHGNLPGAGNGASNPPARVGSGINSPAQMGSEADFSWFSSPCRALLGSDPGLALHVSIGVPERTAYRYASGERPVPGYIVRELLRSPQGWQWLAAFMDGSDAEWWRDLDRARRVGIAALNAARD